MSLTRFVFFDSSTSVRIAAPWPASQRPASAAYSVHSLPRLHRTRVYPSSATLNRPKSDISDFGWRDREGACNKIEGRCKNIHVRTLTPSPTLPRKRGREQTEFAACADFTSHEP